MRRLATFDDVIRKLGGVPKVAQLTKRNTQAVWNWRARGRFPTVLYFVMLEELEANGYTAMRWLWGFEERDTRSADAA